MQKARILDTKYEIPNILALASLDEINPITQRKSKGNARRVSKE
jgi:hypothetical protein